MRTEASKLTRMPTCMVRGKHDYSLKVTIAFSKKVLILFWTEDEFLRCFSDQGASWCSRNPHTIGWMAEEDQRIDLINLSPAMLDVCSVQDCRVMFDTEPWISDHFGLLTVL